MRANEQANGRMAQFSTHRFHAMYTAKADERTFYCFCVNIGAKPNNHLNLKKQRSLTFMQETDGNESKVRFPMSAHFGMIRLAIVCMRLCSCLHRDIRKVEWCDSFRGGTVFRRNKEQEFLRNIS